MVRPNARLMGITLLEVLLAIALLGVLLTMLFIFTETTMQAEVAGRELATRSQLARVVLDRIANEVRQAASFGTAISGDKNSIRVLSTTLPDRDVFERRKVRDKRQASHYDLVEVRYYLKIFEDEYVELDDGTEVPAVAGLYRREWRILGHEGRPSLAQGMSTLPQAVKITVGYKEIELEPVQEAEEGEVIDLNPGTEEPFAPEIKCLKFAYHDGKSWLYRWAYREEELEDEEGEVMSESQIIREEDEEEDETFYPDRYTTVVRLYQSDPTGLGSKLVAIGDELREQFGGLGGEEGSGGLEALGGIEGLGDLGNLGDLSSQLGNLGGMEDQLKNLQHLLGG